jgi:hypothetical protein
VATELNYTCQSIFHEMLRYELPRRVLRNAAAVRRLAGKLCLGMFQWDAFHVSEPHELPSLFFIHSVFHLLQQNGRVFGS